MKKLLVLLLVVLAVMLYAAPAFAYKVTVTADPADGGDVSVNEVPGGGEIAKGKNAVLRATAKDGYVFVGWFRANPEDGDTTAPFSENPEYTFSLEVDRSYVAKFDKKYTFNVNAEPADGGQVSQNGTEYKLGDSVTVTAAPVEGYNFMGWFADPKSDTPVSTDANYTFTIQEGTPETLTAKFAATYKLDLTAKPEGTGSVTGSGAYPGGSIVTAGASPEKDWRFTGWYDADIPGKIISTEPEYQFNLDENRTLVALFDRSYTYTLIWVLIWIGICFAAFVIIMRTIRHFRIARRRNYRNRRRPPTRRY